MVRSPHLRSLAYLSVGDSAGPVEVIEACAAAGFDGVGLRLAAPLGLELAHPVVGRPATVRAIRAAAAHTGVRVFDGEVITLTPDTNVADLLPLLSTLAELDCPLMQITSEDPEWHRAVDNFARLCEQARRFGVRMAFEFMRWRSVKTFEDALALVEQAGQPNGGIVLDALHLSRSGGSPAAVAAAPRERLLYVQLCDAADPVPQTGPALIAEARGARRYPGEGSLWLDALLDVLPPGIPISLEVPQPPSGLPLRERVRRGAASLDAWLARRPARAA